MPFRSTFSPQKDCTGSTCFARAKSNEHSFHGEFQINPSTCVTLLEAGHLLKRLLDDVKVRRIATVCTHGFAHYFHICTSCYIVDDNP